MISKEIENAGLPTALITTLVPAALFIGAYRVIPGCAISHPVGNPSLPPKGEKEVRRKIVSAALKSLETEVTAGKVFQWNSR